MPKTYKSKLKVKQKGRERPLLRLDSLLSKLASDDFINEVIKRYTTSRTISIFKDIAREVVMQEIYSYPEGDYKRTFALLRSFTASATENGITVLSDPSIAPAITGQSKGKGRAAFFEEPKFESFLQLLGRESRFHNRPFHDIMTKEVAEAATEEAPAEK